MKWNDQAFLNDRHKNETAPKVASFAWTMEQYAYEIPVLLFQLEAFQYLFEKQVAISPTEMTIEIESRGSPLV